MNRSTKSLLNVALIVLAAMVVSIGLLVCFSVSGHQQFVIGIVVVGVGFVLFSLIRDFFKTEAKA